MSGAAPARAREASAAPQYTEFHPRWYRPQVSTYWWLGRWPYVKFILRELTSVAVAWTVVFTLGQLWSLARGAEAYTAFTAAARNPFIIAINVVAFGFLLMHSVTWFNLAPKAMAVRIKGKRVPGILIAGPQYAAWLAVSAAVFWIVVQVGNGRGLFTLTMR
jgi:fumarate reductase subunit C